MPSKPPSLADKLKGMTKPAPDILSAKQRKIKAFRSSSQWQKMAALHLKLNPVCADVLDYHKKNNEIRASKEVHHIRGLAERFDLRLNRDNLSALCVKCHHMIENLHRQKKPTYHLFDKKG